VIGVIGLVNEAELAVDAGISKDWSDIVEVDIAVNGAAISIANMSGTPKGNIHRGPLRLMRGQPAAQPPSVWSAFSPYSAHCGGALHLKSRNGCLRLVGQAATRLLLSSNRTPDARLLNNYGHSTVQITGKTFSLVAIFKQEGQSTFR
jgi:hypothetical protein